MGLGYILSLGIRYLCGYGQAPIPPPPVYSITLERPLIGKLESELAMGDAVVTTDCFPYPSNRNSHAT
jgi:hypothetical protein